MAFYTAANVAWYVNSVGYAAVTVRPQNTAVAAGIIRRQFTAPAVGNERCFICVTAGTTANTTDATWVLTRGASTTDGTVTWLECTGAAPVNGDATNTPTWAQMKAQTNAMTIGQIIKRNNGVSYQIATNSGTIGASEPSFSDTTGTQTTDNTQTWKCIGVVGDFTGGQAPFARLAPAFTANWFLSGDTIYVGDNHAETNAAVITLSGNSAAMCRVLCHNHSGSYPPAASDLTTGATVTSTSFTGSVSINMTLQGSYYFYGIAFIAGAGSSSTNCNISIGLTTLNQVQNWYYFDNCSLQLASTGATNILCGVSNSATWTIIVLNNTTMKFGSTGDFLQAQNCQFTWRNTGQILVSGSSIPTTLFNEFTAGSNLFTVVFEAIDLSQLTGSLFATTPSSLGTFTLKDCKLNASATITRPINTGMTVQLIRSDSAAISYTSTRYAYEGTETTETSIVRTDGAVDPTGQAQSRKLVTTANAQWLRPFHAEPYAIWNPTIGSDVVVTVYGTVNAGALPNNDDLWLEVEYLGDATAPLGEIVTTTKASVLASNAAVSSDGSTWGGGGSGAGWSPFKLTATLSSPQPQLAGYLHARVRAAKASTTYYLDPKVVLS